MLVSVYYTCKASTLTLIVSVIHKDADIPPSVETSDGMSSPSSLSSHEGQQQFKSVVGQMLNVHVSQHNKTTPQDAYRRVQWCIFSFIRRLNQTVTKKLSHKALQNYFNSQGRSQTQPICCEQQGKPSPSYALLAQSSMVHSIHVAMIAYAGIWKGCEG